MGEDRKNEGCMVCAKELEYLEKPVDVRCIYCGEEDQGYFICKEGHYVCEECHSKGAIDLITQFCLSSESKNPFEMANAIMKHPKIPMIGPEHHAMIAGVLVTGYRNLTGKGTEDDIIEAIRRGSKVPAGYCGLYGADGVAIATGIALCVILGSTPLSDKERSIANTMTSRALAAVANARGARCCKRSTWIVLDIAVQYIRDVLGVDLEYVPLSEIKCDYSGRNKYCSKEDCIFYVSDNTKD